MLMRIKIQLYTILKKYGEGKINADGTLNLSGHLTLNGLTAFLNLPKKPGKTFLVNNSPRSGSYLLEEGDIVKIYGFICGG
jgi:hypothetical protein